jgi:acyl-CoA synthetase (AMP-forming)/AMP-acid ligase II
VSIPVPEYPASFWELVEGAAAARPDAALVSDDYGRSLTALELRDAALGHAAWLHDRGVGAGTTVSWQLPTTLETIVTQAALARLGAVQNPLIPFLREREVGFITEQVGTDVLVVPEVWRGFGHGDMARTLAARRGFDVVVADLATDPATTGGALRLPTGDPGVLPAFTTSRDLVLWIYYSSGTTADPKGVRHTDQTLMASATGMIVVLGARSDDVNPLAFPIAHIGGMATLTACLVSGMRTVLFDVFDPASTPHRMASHDPTFLGSAVPFYVAYCEAQRREGDRRLFPRLRACPGGGAPVPAEVNREVRETLGVAGIANAWGLTEFPVATFPEPDAATEVLEETVGAVVPGVEVRVVDSGGVVAPTGAEGELRLKGPQCFVGYVDPALDAEAFDDDGWFRTGDLGFVDAAGYVHVTGRLKDVIIRNAENISALEVEEALYRHPDVVDAAVVGFPDPRAGERICAFVVTAPDRTVTLAELVEHCRTLGLAAQKCPERVEVVETLPRNAMGKIQKQELRGRLGAPTSRH